MTTAARCERTKRSDFTIFEAASGFGVSISNFCDNAMISLVREITDAMVFSLWAVFLPSVSCNTGVIGLG
jgi:hypothetical protein